MCNNNCGHESELIPRTNGLRFKLSERVKANHNEKDYLISRARNNITTKIKTKTRNKLKLDNKLNNVKSCMQMSVDFANNFAPKTFAPNLYVRMQIWFTNFDLAK